MLLLSFLNFLCQSFPLMLEDRPILLGLLVIRVLVIISPLHTMVLLRLLPVLLVTWYNITFPFSLEVRFGHVTSLANKM